MAVPNPYMTSAVGGASQQMTQLVGEDEMRRRDLDAQAWMQARGQEHQASMQNRQIQGEMAREGLVQQGWDRQREFQAQEGEKDRANSRLMQQQAQSHANAAAAEEHQRQLRLQQADWDARMQIQQREIDAQNRLESVRLQIAGADLRTRKQLAMIERRTKDELNKLQRGRMKAELRAATEGSNWRKAQDGMLRNITDLHEGTVRSAETGARVGSRTAVAVRDLLSKPMLGGLLDRTDMGKIFDESDRSLGERFTSPSILAPIAGLGSGVLGDIAEAVHGKIFEGNDPARGKFQMNPGFGTKLNQEISRSLAQTLGQEMQLSDVAGVQKAVLEILEEAGQIASIAGEGQTPGAEVVSGVRDRIQGILKPLEEGGKLSGTVIYEAMRQLAAGAETVADELGVEAESEDITKREDVGDADVGREHQSRAWDRVFRTAKIVEMALAGSVPDVEQVEMLKATIEEALASGDSPAEVMSVLSRDGISPVERTAMESLARLEDPAAKLKQARSEVGRAERDISDYEARAGEDEIDLAFESEEDALSLMAELLGQESSRRIEDEVENPYRKLAALEK